MDTQRIDAPQRVVEAIRRADEAMQRIQAEAQAILYGAMAALNVPEGWQWDGSGWSEGRGATGELPVQE